jgi:hypothetical protein
MNKLFYFVSGILVGIYIDQNYIVPKISNYIDKLKSDVKKYEKK